MRKIQEKLLIPFVIFLMALLIASCGGSGAGSTVVEGNTQSDDNDVSLVEETSSATTTSATTTTLPMGMTLIPSGSFTMGDISGDGESDERPTHIVELSSFYISNHEVTLGEYHRYNPNHVNTTLFFGFDSENDPVVKVNWNKAQDYIRWLNETAPLSNGTIYRLCTEAEWEYAARAGTSTKWICGDDESCLNDIAWYSENSEGKIQDVMQKKPNMFGLYDMHGNAAEWVQDYYDSSYYLTSPSVDPTGPITGSDRILRGGSYAQSAEIIRVSDRIKVSPSNSLSSFGFRLCSS